MAGNHVANEFADQLGLSIASRSPVALESMGKGSNPASSHIIDRWVNAEVLGNVGVLIAFDQAQQTLEAIAEARSDSLSSSCRGSVSPGDGRIFGSSSSSTAACNASGAAWS